LQDPGTVGVVDDGDFLGILFRRLVSVYFQGHHAPGAFVLISILFDGRFLGVVVSGSASQLLPGTDGKDFVKGMSQIDPTKKPKTIDFTPTEGDNQGKTCLGIYELGEDMRKLCYAEPGKDRPTRAGAAPATTPPGHRPA
jgi:uncharacterized protein (TIGR03067 family)